MNGGGSSRVYLVEARMSMNLPPVEVAGMLVDCRWRQVPLARAPASVGVPSDWSLNAIARDHGFVSYAAAMALAWWFLAIAHAGYGVGVEVRLVEHKFEYSYSAERGTEGESIGVTHAPLPAAKESA